MSKTREIRFSQAIPRTHGKDAEGSPRVIREDLAENANDRKFEIVVGNVPEGIDDLVCEVFVRRYFYKHGSFMNCDLYVFKDLVHGTEVKVDWNIAHAELLEAATRESSGSSETTETFKLWKLGTLTEEAKAALSEGLWDKVLLKIYDLWTSRKSLTQAQKDSLLRADKDALNKIKHASQSL